MASDGRSTGEGVTRSVARGTGRRTAGRKGGRPDDEAYRDLAAELRDEVAGDVRFDEYSQVLYATDGSVYGARPAGVVLPESVADVQAAVRVAAEHDVPVLPRGAGSSLAGQAVGPGCVVLDCSKHLDSVLEIDPEDRRARIQPGVVQDDLDAALEPHGLKFAPDPASSNRATVGGGVGNNSTGAHSVRYGITDAYTEELRVVLADGSLLHTREVVLDSEEWDRIVGRDDREADLYRTVRGLVEGHAEEIERRYPTLKRSVSGYNLHKVVYRTEDGERVINLSKLFVGAEGTLGVVVEAELSLVTRPEETALACYCFRDLVSAMEAVPPALDCDASAVELMDDEVFRLARESSQYADYAEPIPEDCAAALMLEFDGEVHDDLRVAVDGATERFVDAGDAYHVVEAFTPESQDRLWKLRKAAIPLLMSLPGDPKPYPFIEDASVPPEELAAYVTEFEEVLDDHDTSAAYFAHAGAGTLHIRPILNLKDGDGIETMRSITDAVTDLVLDHGGAFSGEHGDGLARTEFNPKMYGPDLWGAFRELKTAFDPNWLMNPGKVVFRDGGADSDTRGTRPDMRDHLRYGPEYASLEESTTLDFSEEGGFSELVELCNGCGTCRQTGSEVMCPTYRATDEELLTTRGRANLLRAAISGDLPEDELYTDRFQRQVLDLCVGCKGCASDCPTGVDLAKLKAEAKHRYHEREGTSLRSRLFADIDRLAAWGSRLAPVANAAPTLPGARPLLERLLGIAADRSLPTFADESLETWFDRRGSRVDPGDADHRVLLFPDTFSNYVEPAVGKATVRVLEACGVHVAMAPDAAPSGRAAYSNGFLDLARERAEHNRETLAPLVADGWSVVCPEPADATMFQDEYADLLGADRVAPLAANCYSAMEFISVHGVVDGVGFDTGNRRLTYHGHCNQQALGREHHAARVLEAVGFAVDELDSTCCGMAGSFGYETEHFELSKAIGSILFDQVDASPGDAVVAPGASCRTQLGDRAGEESPRHPVQVLASALPPDAE
ncbi:FAD-binding and (Fe-S)-binding domain-containing protein [Halobium salinum]|uniref:FAD-binding and (Fe-S)-binding domain-containing protein n=1 Tax=Halobium salinum TaxID=1364940 RepID=A0ABD5PES9_9EURY|nr:FAD-binding oxidoreductase [Halobium salinum]